MEPAVSVHAREAAIVRCLQSSEEPLAIRDVWELLQRPKDEDGIEDTASLPTYHRTFAKLVTRGHIEELPTDEDGAARYKATDQLSAYNPYTLVDLEAALWELSVPEALARYVDAVDYFEANAGKVLAKAGEGLLKEEPRALILRMLQDEVTDLHDDLADLKDHETAEPEHRARTDRRIVALRQFVHGELGIGAKIWDIPADVEELLAGRQLEPSWNTLSEELSLHVFGETFLQSVVAVKEDGGLVAGSDGSAHSGYVRGVPAPAYAEDEGRLVLTFNNSVAFVDVDPSVSGIRFPYHGVPMSRSALEDPHNRGMIISRPWFPSLKDGEFEHMKKVALDVVQFRVDERVMKGAARAFGAGLATAGGGLLPKPNVLVRDGAVAPQARELQNYTHPSAYGDIVREGIALSWSILQEVKSSDRRVFAGAVKQTQLRTFSRVVNWYIKRGSAKRFGAPIDASWDIARASHVSDSASVTRLIGSLPKVTRGNYYRTCIVVRPFTAMITALQGVRKETKDEWLEWFVEWTKRRTDEWKKHGGEKPWLASVDVADDPYVRMCQEADYAMFFFGVPGGEPHLTFPRFEFMDALRERKGDIGERVIKSAQRIINGIHATHWHVDKEHNFLTKSRLPRLTPFVVYEAHEKCKVMGAKLENELRQAIAMMLSQLKGARGLAAKADIEPMSARAFRDRILRRLPGKKADEDE